MHSHSSHIALVMKCNENLNELKGKLNWPITQPVSAGLGCCWHNWMSVSGININWNYAPIVFVSNDVLAHLSNRDPELVTGPWVTGNEAECWSRFLWAGLLELILGLTLSLWAGLENGDDASCDKEGERGGVCVAVLVTLAPDWSSLVAVNRLLMFLCWLC